MPGKRDLLRAWWAARERIAEDDIHRGCLASPGGPESGGEAGPSERRQPEQTLHLTKRSPRRIVASDLPGGGVTCGEGLRPRPFTKRTSTVSQSSNPHRRHWEAPLLAGAPPDIPVCVGKNS